MDGSPLSNRSSVRCRYSRHASLECVALSCHRSGRLLQSLACLISTYLCHCRPVIGAPHVVKREHLILRALSLAPTPDLSGESLKSKRDQYTIIPRLWNISANIAHQLASCGRPSQ
ncbi:hypothetical protein OBBRIDRAFT_259295 [Obba rivulosa]|uniref:Uncharacterized protein n=1 Tax=Obba rivulosa TaxID=1052685 RepID=A0A8E2DKT5_9APHY|nr:hypothetical protein OBBRIDRAFT_259295 [Obba rivulosa]